MQVNLAKEWSGYIVSHKKVLVLLDISRDILRLININFIYFFSLEKEEALTNIYFEASLAKIIKQNKTNRLCLMNVNTGVV